MQAVCLGLASKWGFTAPSQVQNSFIHGSHLSKGICFTQGGKDGKPPLAGEPRQDGPRRLIAGLK